MQQTAEFAVSSARFSKKASAIQQTTNQASVASTDHTLNAAGLAGKIHVRRPLLGPGRIKVGKLSGELWFHTHS